MRNEREKIGHRLRFLKIRIAYSKAPSHVWECREGPMQADLL